MATWSFRERAVWSLPPSGPMISVRRRSTAMWMSSSSSAKRNSSLSSSAAIWSRPPLICSLSSALRTPARSSARACACEPRTSSRQSRRSNPIEALIRANRGSGGSSKRGMRWRTIGATGARSEDQCRTSERLGGSLQARVGEAQVWGRAAGPVLGDERLVSVITRSGAGSHAVDSASLSADATRSTSPSLIAGKNGSASRRADASSATGN